MREKVSIHKQRLMEERNRNVQIIETKNINNIEKKPINLNKIKGINFNALKNLKTKDKVLIGILSLALPLAANQFIKSKTPVDVKEAGKTYAVTETVKKSEEVVAAAVSHDFSEKTIEVTVWNHLANRIDKMDFEEYVACTIGGELYPNMDDKTFEALAICARSYGAAHLERNKDDDGNYKGVFNGAMFTSDHNVFQAYRPIEELKEKGIYDKIKKAVDNTRGKVLVYNGEIINALYFSTSSGKTVDNVDYYGNDVPYLKSVDSPFDVGTKNYQVSTNIHVDKFVELFKEKQPEIELDKGKIAEQIKIEEVAPSGHIRKVTVANKTITGREFRQALGINSANFSVVQVNDTVIVTTKGYGHGIGLSQFGAEGMAKAGKSVDEILKHYYTGVEIEKKY